MVYIGSFSSFVKLGGKISKNIIFCRVLHVRLDEIHVRGPKLVYEHVWIVNFCENIPMDHTSVLDEKPKVSAKTVQDSPSHEGNRRQ